MSRSEFEAIYEPMGFDMTRMYVAVPEPWSQYKDEKTGYAWAGWLAGRESMRDEAAEKKKLLWECNECGSQEYTMAVSEADVNQLGCGNCGACEWHKAEEKP